MPALGICLFHDLDKGCGYIKYSSSGLLGSKERLDQTIGFRSSECDGKVETGTRVTFETESDCNIYAPDKLIAKSVTPVVRLTGTIATVGKSGYSFIEGQDENGDFVRIFAHCTETVPDALARRIFPVGTPVSYFLSEARGVKEAIDIRNEDPELYSFDLTNYRETGKVTFFDSGRDRGHIQRGTGGHVGHANAGETIPFLFRNVVCGHADEIEVCSWLEYSISYHRFLFDKTKLTFWHRVFAFDLCTFDTSAVNTQPNGCASDSIEAAFLAAPELPLDSPKSEQLAPGSVYTPAEKRMTIRELIAKSAK